MRHQISLREREPYPQEAEALARRPGDDPAIDIAMKWWHELSTERSFGFGAGPIPASKIDALCDRHRLDRDAAEYLKAALMYVDNRQMAASAAKRKTS